MRQGPVEESLFLILSPTYESRRQPPRNKHHSFPFRIMLGGHCELQCVWQRYILMWPSSRISLYMPMADPTVTHEINAIQRKRRALLATDVSMWLVFVSVWDGDVEYQFNVASTTSWINAIHSRTTTARKQTHRFNLHFQYLDIIYRIVICI